MEIMKVIGHHFIKHHIIEERKLLVLMNTTELLEIEDVILSYLDKHKKKVLENDYILDMI